MSDRVAVLVTIRVYRETIAAMCSDDPEMALRVRVGDQAALDALLDLACARTGLTRAAYEEAVAGDAQLLDLQRLSIQEVVVDPPDPGPYAEISPESPAGTPANWHLDTSAALRAGRTALF
jgi:hypothetical protein